MGMISGLMKGAVARKVMNEARKPQNQQKAKDLFHQLTNKGSKGSKGSSGKRY